MNLLNEDNIVHIFLNKIGDIIIANLLFIFCCIPIITVGPSLTALYHCSLRSVKGNNNGTIKTFFRAFKQNFLQSIIIWVFFLVVSFILIGNLQFLQNNYTTIGRFLFYVSLGISGLVIILALYIFAVIAAFENKITMLIRNSFAFAFLHFPSSILIAIVSILPMVMTYRDLELLPLYACCWFFFGFGLTAYLNSLLFYRMFKPFLESNDPPHTAIDK